MMLISHTVGCCLSKLLGSEVFRQLDNQNNVNYHVDLPQTTLVVKLLKSSLQSFDVCEYQQVRDIDAILFSHSASIPIA